MDDSQALDLTFRLHMKRYRRSIGEGEGSFPNRSFWIIGKGKAATQPVAGEMLFCLWIFIDLLEAWDWTSFCKSKSLLPQHRIVSATANGILQQLASRGPWQNSTLL